MRTLNAALVLASIAVAPIVCAADLGDPQRGLVYAKKACAECHVMVQYFENVEALFG